ncbi:piggyBac transposable element-derived protein 4-like [Colias croceus]|uniref:piggyBac transposable element-derived protein 4-like n=1 Tax=Colias crocea TaxID=72248 RepID=UPI001E27D4B1|nr:piggyBac transposable element-derived protein 4-like [Colias croceus]
MTCDSATRYMIDAMPYLGKCTQTNGLPLGEFYVKELTKAVHGSNRNVTCDNWFTSVPLAKNLLRQPYNLTLVGTIRSNKREIPDELKKMQSRRVGTSMFCYDGPLTLVSYKPKPSKMVFVLSSCDEEGTVHPTTGKPNMIHFYNETKGGVDTFDQMCSTMSCSRKTNRWPMAMFYGILNMSFINSYIVYCDNVLSKKEKPLGRRDFMKKLSNTLMTPWMETRQQMLTLPTNIKEKISGMLPKRQAEPSTQREDVPEPKKRKYCAFCPSKIRRMTKTMCDSCKNPICGEHKSSACPKCL